MKIQKELLVEGKRTTPQHIFSCFFELFLRHISRIPVKRPSENIHTMDLQQLNGLTLIIDRMELYQYNGSTSIGLIHEYDELIHQYDEPKSILRLTYIDKMNHYHHNGLTH